MTPHPSAVPPAPLSAPQTSAGLFIPPWLLVLLRWPYRPLSRLRSSLRLRVGLRLPPPFRLCLLRACATPPGSAVLRVSVLCRMVLCWPSVPIIEPCLIISCSVYYYSSGWPFCRSLGLRWPYLWLSGSRWPLRSSSGLGWPPLALLLLRVHPLVLGFLSRLRSLAWCRSLRGPQPVVLQCLNVRRSDLLPFLIVFPQGFRLSTPGCMFGLRLYIAVRRLYRLFCSVRGDAVRSPLPVAMASAFMYFMAKAAASSSVFLRSLFIFLLVHCFMRVPA